MKDMWGDDWVD
jgi:hypothetical protein